jgi:AGZA family xanthine/uracil permease-like MFS transporter
VLTGFRAAVFRAVPKSLRTGIALGIGLFITFVGLVDAGIVRRPFSPTAPPVELGINGTLFGWPALVFVLGLALLIGLYANKVKGSMLIAILGTAVFAGVAVIVKNPPAS